MPSSEENYCMNPNVITLSMNKVVHVEVTLCFNDAILFTIDLMIETFSPARVNFHKILVI